jgi:uncharacterized protein (TIRG00374 family)
VFRKLRLSEGNRKKMRALWNLLKYGLGIGLLAYIIWQYWSYSGPDGEQMGLVNAIGKPIHSGVLLLAAGICLLAVLLTFARWYILVRAQELPFTLGNAMRLGLIGYYLNFFFPGAVGGDIVKATFIAREQRRRTVAVATVLIDRAIGLLGLFWLAALVGGIFWLGGHLESIAVGPAAAVLLEHIVKVAMVLAGSSVVFWILLGFLPARRADKFAWRLSRIPKVGHSLAEFWRAVWMYRNRGRSVLAAMLLAMIGHVGFVFTFYLAALTFHQVAEVPSLGAHFLVVPVAKTVEAIPFSFGGLGVGEVAYGKLYSGIGFAFDRGVLGCLTMRVITWVLGFAGYLVYLRMKPALRPAVPQAMPNEAITPEAAIPACGRNFNAA